MAPSGEAELVARVVALMGELIDDPSPRPRGHRLQHRLDAGAAAAARALRLPFIGTVPAIKPACAASRSKLVTVLGTEATVSREYTRALIRDFADGSDVKLVGSAQLAAYAEAELHGAPVADRLDCSGDRALLRRVGGRRTDTIVLACTHYPLLLERLERLAPWPVTFIDPAPAIARRVVDLSGPVTGPAAGGAATIVFTSGRPPSPALEAALAGFRNPSLRRAVSEFRIVHRQDALASPTASMGREDDDHRISDRPANRAVQVHAARPPIPLISPRW